jgi:chromate transporter
MRFWLKLGFISFGGPAGQIAIMHRELVERRRWISDERFLHALNYCMLLPGPEAQQLATYIGWLFHRAVGGIIAGVLFVLPSVFVLLGLSYVYAHFGNVPVVAGMLAGFKPVVVAIVVEAIVKIGRRALRASAHFGIAAAAFVAIYFLQVPFPLIVVAAAIVGLVGVRALPSIFTPHREAPGRTRTQGSPGTGATPAIGDDGPLPEHTRPSAARSFRVAAVGTVLWAVPLVALVLWRGGDSLHAHEYRFFTQAAFVTFGGAYAVLAYVTQAAAWDFGWLTPTQAIDGLALAETTPGPLIMVLQFVGFMAGWNHPGGLGQTVSAVLGALVATYATFLPCFLLIFLGAPYIEVLRGHDGLRSALSGVTASVVGVVLNLALVFGAAVLWPGGPQGGVSWFALTMSVAAFVVLFRWKVDVLWVVLAGGALGLLRAILFG